MSGQRGQRGERRAVGSSLAVARENRNLSRTAVSVSDTDTAVHRYGHFLAIQPETAALDRLEAEKEQMRPGIKTESRIRPPPPSARPIRRWRCQRYHDVPSVPTDRPGTRLADSGRMIRAAHIQERRRSAGVVVVVQSCVESDIPSSQPRSIL